MQERRSTPVQAVGRSATMKQQGRSSAVYMMNHRPEKAEQLLALAEKKQWYMDLLRHDTKLNITTIRLCKPVISYLQIKYIRCDCQDLETFSLGGYSFYFPYAML